MKTIKILLLGDSCTGKTAFRVRYCDDRFHNEYIPTAFENDSKTIEIGEKSYVLIFAGEQKAWCYLKICYFYKQSVNRAVSLFKK